MDEDIAIINNNTRNQRIKDFFTKNKKLLISLLIFLILILLSFYSYQIYQDKNKIDISDKYNSAIIKHKNGDNSGIISAMQEIVENKDPTYSPLALYYLIDNELINDKSKINSLFEQKLAGHVLFTGGSFGFEGSIILTLFLCISIYLMDKKFQSGL